MSDINKCSYCGQVRLDGGFCDCPQAQKQRKIEDQITRAKETIKLVFVNCEEQGLEPVPESAVNLMNYVIREIAQRNMLQVQITINARTKAKLSLGSKGQVNIERVETQKLTSEVEE